MNKRYNSRGVQPRRNALVIALAMGLGVTGVAYGQATTGSIYGTAPVAAGETVVVTGASGVNRSVAVDSTGHYTINNLPAGKYTVTLQKDGQTVATRSDVGINVGGGTSVPFSAPSTTNLQGVQVVASALPAIDVTSVNSSTTITAADLQRLPVGRNAESIALLSPGTVSGSGFFGNAVSFGGSSVTENAYYINGYNTGEPYRNIGGFSLPYGSIAQQQTFTGGYSAQYGRSDGGVINQVGKRGTNEWHFGAQVLWAPKSLAASPDNVYYPNPKIPADTPTDPANPGDTHYVIANPALPGTIARYKQDNKTWQTTYSAYVGGPLIKDTLYVFLAADQTTTRGSSVGSLLDSSTRTSTTANNGHAAYYSDHSSNIYGKLDWNINDSNVLELTKLQHKENNGAGTTYNYNYATNAATSFLTPNDKTANDASFTIAKFTSYLSDNATLSVEYGKGSFQNGTVYGYQGTLPFISNYSSNTNPALRPATVLFPQTNTALAAPDASDSTKGLRVDFTYQAGSHLLGVGIDNMEYASHDQGNYASGPNASITDPHNPVNGYFWSYRKSTSTTRPYYVIAEHIAQITSMTMDQKAYYLQDVWNATDTLQINIGLRNDRFTNYNDVHQAFVDEKNQWEPRLGVSWDVFGDSTFKVYGNAGRYYLALPDNAAERAANKSSFLYTYFDYAGINGNGQPTDAAGNVLVPGVSTSFRGPLSPDGESGAAKDPRQVTSSNLKAEYQDEYIIGFDKTLGPKWVYGAKITYRDLKTAIDDECSPSRIAAKLAAEGITGDFYDSLYGAAYCRLINPGQSNVLAIRDGTTGAYTNVTMDQKDWGYLKAPKRTYAGLDLYLEHPFDGKWQARIDYTLASDRGNTEGQVRSDFGQNDVSKTEDWDSWQLMNGQDGELFNMHKHTLKLRGFYQITPEWLVSGTATVQSGAPQECLGYYGVYGDGDPTGYNQGGSGNYHWCGGKIVHPGFSHTPWMKQLNLGVTYRPSFADNKLAFNLNVYNVFDGQVALQTNAIGESGDHIVNNSYGMGQYFQQPRFTRLSVSYDY